MNLTGTVLENSSPIRGFVFESLKSIGMWFLSHRYWFVGSVVLFVFIVWLYGIIRDYILNRLQK